MRNAIPSNDAKLIHGNSNLSLRETKVVWLWEDTALALVRKAGDKPPNGLRPYLIGLKPPNGLRPYWPGHKPPISDAHTRYVHQRRELRVMRNAIPSNDAKLIHGNSNLSLRETKVVWLWEDTALALVRKAGDKPPNGLRPYLIGLKPPNGLRPYWPGHKPPISDAHTRYVHQRRELRVMRKAIPSNDAKLIHGYSNLFLRHRKVVCLLGD